jgi:flagellar motility protein MotE (MotC chaperone)
VKEGAVEVKEQRAVILDLKQHIKHKEIGLKRARKEEIRQQTLEVADKVKQRREAFAKHVQQQQRLRALEEIAEVERRHKQIEKMEEVESRLLERLQHTQKKESEVFQSLTSAIREAL